VSEKELEQFIREFSGETAAEGRDVLKKLRARMPGAIELVYDNYAGLVIGFSATEKASDAVLSIILRRDHVTLCFLHGATLRDPHQLLRGEGKRVRHIRLQNAQTLDEPAVAALIAQSIATSPAPFTGEPRRTIVRGIARRRLPRRPAPAKR